MATLSGEGRAHLPPPLHLSQEEDDLESGAMLAAAVAGRTTLFTMAS